MPPPRASRILVAPLVLLIGGCALAPEQADVGPENERGGEAVVAVDGAPRPGPRKPRTAPSAKRIDAGAESAPEAVAEAELPRSRTAPGDLIGRIVANYALPDHDHPRAERERAFFLRHPDYLARVVERSRPYLHLIVEEVEARGLPGELALLPVIESAFQPLAYSHGRAAGLWQFIPSTGRVYGLKQNWWYDGRRDVKAATAAALDYLEKLNRDFEGDWLLSLAAYNAGEGTVMRAVKRNASDGKPTDFWSLKLPRETTAYVPKLLAVSALFGAPEAFGLTLPEVADIPVLTEVETGGQIDLARAADLAGISVDELYRLNPAFNRWATDPDGPHTLLLPRDNAERFLAGLATLDPDGRLQWRRHAIRAGENLGAIADRYRTTPAVLRQVNQLDGNLIRAGDHLLIPVASRATQAHTHHAAQRQAQAQAETRAPDAGGKRVTHTVRGGESLWSIGRRYGVSSRSLARWNGMGSRDTLAIGHELTVWLPASSKAPERRRDGLLQRVNYTVRPGDSLYAIAARFGVDIDDLRRWNGLDGDLLHPGQRLTLHVDVTRQASAG